MFFILSFAQSFPVSEIPESLKENANMVIRLDEKTYEISPGNQIISHEKHVYTILNEAGAAYATYKTYYNNRAKTISNVKGYLFDAAGNEIRHFKAKDMEDHPAYDGFSLITDDRVKSATLYSHSFPYTVAFYEEDILTEQIQLEDWIPQINTGISVQKAIFKISVPKDFDLRYKMLNSSLQPAVRIENNKKNYTWEIQNLIAYAVAPVSNIVNIVPHLMIGLDEIDMGGYKGSMSSWAGFSSFYYSLQKGRDVLPEGTKRKVHELTDGINDTSKKVSRLYNYLQQNTRYINIKLGIGGWQAYDAHYVATNKYGDCKALSNFMVSLLKEAGIPAYAVIIRGGNEWLDFESDFINDPFNHIICCVPMQKDTIWLECTSQTLPAGYLSEFTSNRYGLLAAEKGGGLVHTPAYSASENLQERKITSVLDKDGKLIVNAVTSYQAVCQDAVADAIDYHSKDEQLTRLKSEFSLPTYDVVSFDYQKNYSKLLPVIKETVQLEIQHYGQITGKRIFVNPNVLTRSSNKMAADPVRRLNVEIVDAFTHIDSVEIAIPDGYVLETKPVDIFIENKFGKFSCQTLVRGNKISYFRSKTQYNLRFPAGDYAAIVQYLNTIYESDYRKIVFVKQN